jgi:hypothetical protein
LEGNFYLTSIDLTDKKWKKDFKLVRSIYDLYGISIPDFRSIYLLNNMGIVESLESLKTGDTTNTQVPQPDGPTFFDLLR